MNQALPSHERCISVGDPLAYKTGAGTLEARHSDGAARGRGTGVLSLSYPIMRTISQRSDGLWKYTVLHGNLSAFADPLP
jgi:predicted nuclease with RNAse H fold